LPKAAFNFKRGKMEIRNKCRETDTKMALLLHKCWRFLRFLSRLENSRMIWVRFGEGFMAGDSWNGLNYENMN
jgi:hypothetical protein